MFYIEKKCSFIAIFVVLYTIPLYTNAIANLDKDLYRQR